MPVIMGTPGRQERDEAPSRAPRKSKHQRGPQHNLRPKKLRYETDTQYNSCAAAQQDTSQEEFVDSKFFVGSIVWAKLDSYPWWPAMIDDDPDSCLYVCNKDPYNEDRVRFGAASEQSRVLAQLKLATKASATKLPNGTPVLFETLLSIMGGQTQESLEGIGNINSLIQFLGNDVEKDGRSDDGTCLADAKTEIVPASDATASGELLSQLMPTESTTASVPPFGEESRSEQRNTTTSSGMQSGTDLVPEVAPMKQVKQGVPKFFKEKTAFKGDKSKTLSKAKREINGKPKKLKKPGAKEPAADVVAQLLNDAAALAKQAKGPAERAGKALASARPTVTPARTFDNITAEVPAKPATAPASGSFKAAAVLLPKPVAMVPTVAVQLKEVAALEKPAAKTGSVEKTVTGMQATHKAPHQKRLFKVPTKETATTPPEAFASPKEMPITRANCDKDQLTSSGSWTTLEDSDFDALSNTTSLTFDNDLSSASQDIETDCDTDFVSLETVDCSQAFAMQE
ncbi:transcription regulatory protein, putative [Ixodes scapularis]|uniref:Transcription regulatory protein, putative n=1 Tax=Ixodes scapularis TaxID=6945 RepID=B7PJP3_IXOSC|nr:transcription regulatory protein, putative [Ixodes scapularis]|eukprot:XP_002408373.1 transcription regulatory protein, putative [Ixodes scapularis]